MVPHTSNGDQNSVQTAAMQIASSNGVTSVNNSVNAASASTSTSTICWGGSCGCDCCCNWSSDCCPWLWSPDEPLVLRGNLAKLSEKMKQKETSIINHYNQTAGNYWFKNCKFPTQLSWRPKLSLWEEFVHIFPSSKQQKRCILILSNFLRCLVRGKWKGGEKK